MAGNSTPLHTAELEAKATHKWTLVVERAVHAICTATEELAQLRLACDKHVEGLIVESLPSCRAGCAAKGEDDKHARADKVKQALQGQIICKK